MTSLIAAVTRHHTASGVATAGSLFASISLSNIPSWVAVVTSAGAFFGLAALRATATLWRGERDAERAKADRLEEELKTSQLEHDKTKHRLELAESKPDIEKLYDLMRAHDERVAVTSKGIADALQEVASNLAANTNALQLWATEQAQKI